MKTIVSIGVIILVAYIIHEKMVQEEAKIKKQVNTTVDNFETKWGE
jgi:hypothetical protein